MQIQRLAEKVGSLLIEYLKTKDVFQNNYGQANSALVAQLLSMVEVSFTGNSYSRSIFNSLAKYPEDETIIISFLDELKCKLNNEKGLLYFSSTVLKKIEQMPSVPSRNITVEGNVSRNNIIISGDNNIVNSSQIRKIVWSEVRAKCLEKTKARLESLEQRMLGSELYVHREQLQNHINSFVENNNKKYFALVGKSGIGKSSFLWGMIKEFEKKKPQLALLFADATSVIRSVDRVSVFESLIADLGIVLGVPPKEVLNVIQPNEKGEEKLIFIIDALNEFQNFEDIETILSDFQHNLGDKKWIKLILSCRPNFWRHMVERLLRTANFPPNQFYKDPITDEIFIQVEEPNKTEIENLYDRHKKKFNLTPDKFSDLNDKIQERLKEPLILRVVSEICQGDSVNDYSDLILLDISAIPAYMNKLVDLGRLGCADQEFIKNVISRLFVESGKCKRYIPRGIILDKAPSTEAKNCLEYLINAGILKEDQNSFISFSFERFYGYYLGVELNKLAQDGKFLTCDRSGI